MRDTTFIIKYGKKDKKNNNKKKTRAWTKSGGYQDSRCLDLRNAEHSFVKEKSTNRNIVPQKNWKSGLHHEDTQHKWNDHPGVFSPEGA